MPNLEGELCDFCWDDGKKEVRATHFIAGTPLCADHHTIQLKTPSQRFGNQRKWCRTDDCSAPVAQYDGQYCSEHSVKAPQVAPVKHIPIPKEPKATKPPVVTYVSEVLEAKPIARVTHVTSPDKETVAFRKGDAHITVSELTPPEARELRNDLKMPMDPKHARSAQVAKNGIRTGADFSNFMAALMQDLVEGKIDANTANAACKAGSTLLTMVQMQMKERSSGKILKLSDGGDIEGH